MTIKHRCTPIHMRYALSPLCAAWLPGVWLLWPWISGGGGVPPCCESPAASGSAAESRELAPACRSLRAVRKYKNDERKSVAAFIHQNKNLKQQQHNSRSYRAAPRCRSGCRKRGCWTEVAAVCVRSAEPGPHRAASYTEAGRQRSQPALGWPPPPAHQEEIRGSPLPLPSTHQPWGRGKWDFKYSVTEKVRCALDLEWKYGHEQAVHDHSLITVWPQSG